MRCSYSVVYRAPDKGILVLRDLDQGVSITNDAENLIQHLSSRGEIYRDTSVLYYDTQGTLDYILHDGERFLGFSPGPRRRPSL